LRPSFARNHYYLKVYQLDIKNELPLFKCKYRLITIFTHNFFKS
jgi:hypothetical protein